MREPVDRLIGRVGTLTGNIGGPLATLAAVAFCAQLGIAVMLPLLPLYATELGAPPVALGLLTSGFAVVFGLTQLAAGFAVDRYGSRWFIAGGLGMYAACNAMIAAAGNAVSLVVLRAASGIGGGLAVVAERVYLAEMTPPQRRAFGNGVLSAAAAAGLVAGPAAGGVIAGVAGLRSVFVVVALTSALAMIAACFLPPGRFAPPAATDTGAGAARPKLPVGPLVVLACANAAMFAGYGGFITTYAPLATSRLGWSTVEVGVVFTFFGLGSVVLGPALSHLADRVGRRPVAIAAAAPVALFGLALVSGWPRAAVFAVAVVAGGGFTAFTAAWYAMLADAAPGDLRGRVFGVVSGLSSGGVVVGAMLASVLWEGVGLPAGMISAIAAVVLSGLVLSGYRRTVPPVAGPRPG